MGCEFVFSVKVFEGVSEEVMALGKPAGGDAGTVVAAAVVSAAAAVCICATVHFTASDDVVSSGTHSRSTFEQLFDRWSRVL